MARVQLRVIARRLDELQHGKIADEVRDVVSNLLTRDKPIRKAPPKSARLTPKLKAEIRAYAKMFPKKPIHEIAIRFEVNPGRVSEVLNGKK